MGSPLLFLASLSSLLPLALSHWMALGSAESNQVLLGLTLLPWMALSGLPAGGRTVDWKAELSGSWVMLPILALAWSLDREGLELVSAGSHDWQALLIAVLALSGLKFASYRAGTHSHWYAGLWALFVPGAAVLSGLVSSFSGSASGAPGFIRSESLANWSPLSYCLRLTSGDASLLSPLSISCLFASVAVLIAAAEFDRRQQ